MSSEDSVTTTTTTAATTSSTSSTMTTPLECRDDPETPLPPPPPLPKLPLPIPIPISLPSSTNASQPHHAVTKTVRKHRKHVHTSHGTFIWIDGKKIRSALTYKKWPPRPRRVTFPTDDSDLVTGFLEPDNPWKLAENVKIEDLISSYKISCERHCTEPLQNVITQLEKLDISDDERCPELCLRNEILEQKRCEPLEEIFKRVQFEKIDVEATSLDDESAVTLFDMFEYYESVTHLDLSNNRDVGARGWHACAHMIKKTPCLETLEARNIVLTQQHMNILKRPLQLVSHLHVLKLENCGLAGRAFVILVSALKMNTGVKELYLADNNLEQEDAIQLGALLRVNNHLQLLDISNNHIEDEGARDILDGLITQSSEQRAGKGLGILVLWNNDLTKHSSGHFTQTIAESVTLETLNIGKNSVSNELLEMAREALVKNRTLLQLGMQSTNITCKGALALADIIERNRSLQRIDLRDNNIQMTGLTALSFAMKKNTSITQMDLDDKPWSKTPATMHQYLDLVSSIRNYCSRNDEPSSTETSTEDTSSSQHRSRLSSVSSRKISLTCQTLPRSSSSVTPATNETRSLLEPNVSSSSGRLRSPAPSPIPSPVASPIPSPSRSRFVVSRVSEASLSSPNLSASSSPVPPSSLSSSPTCYFTSADGTSSRFRVVTITEPSVKSSIEKTVVTLPSTNVTVGFNCNVREPNSVSAIDHATTSVGKLKIEKNNRGFENVANVRGDVETNFEEEDENLTEIDGEKANGETKHVNDVRNEAAMTVEEENPRVCPEYVEIPVAEDNREVEVRILDNEIPTTSNSQENFVSDVTKNFEQPIIPRFRNIDNVPEEINETQSITLPKSDETLNNDEITFFKFETKKTEPVQRQATSLERLLNLFQHPSSLFTGNTFTEGTETKNSLQDGVNSMIALGDKFHQYFRESGGSGKSSNVNTSSHVSLQRSVSDTARSSVKIDPVKSSSIPQQLSNVRSISVVDESLRKNNVDSTKISTEMSTGIRSMRDKTDDSTIVEFSPKVSTSTKNDDVQNTIVNLPLPETTSTIATNETKEIAKFASNETIVQSRWDFASEIVNSATLNLTFESRTAKCAQKLKDIPENSIVETTGTLNDEDKNLSSIVDVENNLKRLKDEKMKCDSDETNSINDSSYKKSSLRSVVTCYTSGVECLHNSSRKTDDVHNFLNEPLTNDEAIDVDASEDCAVILISASEKDDGTRIVECETLREIENFETNDWENFSSECTTICNEYGVLSGFEDASLMGIEEGSRRIVDRSGGETTVVMNNVDSSLSTLNDSSKNFHSGDGNDKNIDNERLTMTKVEDPSIVDEEDEFTDTVEEYLPVDVVPGVAITATCCQLAKVEEIIAMADEESNIVAVNIREDENSSCSTKNSAITNVSPQKTFLNDEIVIEEPTIIPEKLISLSNPICSTSKEDTINIQLNSPEHDDFVEISPIETISNSSHGDSDSTSKLSIDDVRTNEISSTSSTSNLPANDTMELIVSGTSMTNSNRESIDFSVQESSAKTSADLRSIVRPIVDAVSTSHVDLSNLPSVISIADVKSNEFPQDFVTKNDTATNANEFTNVISITDVKSNEFPQDLVTKNDSATNANEFTNAISITDVKTNEFSQDLATKNDSATNANEITNVISITDVKTNEFSQDLATKNDSATNANEITNVISITDVKTNEFSQDLATKNDTATNANVITSRIVTTTVQKSEETANLAYILSAETSRSTTNLYIEKSRTVHSNSQDSGIEEAATVLLSDYNVYYEGDNRTRESFQESVDSGIDSEGSSVCARVEVGADVQKERARDPGKSTIVVEIAKNVVGDFSSTFGCDETNDGILSVARINETTENMEIEDDCCSTKDVENIIVARNNETTTD